MYPTLLPTHTICMHIYLFASVTITDELLLIRISLTFHVCVMNSVIGNKDVVDMANEKDSPQPSTSKVCLFIHMIGYCLNRL
jgi:hypothetical protein